MIRSFSKVLLAVTVAASALALTPTVSDAAERGLCTARVNAFKWGHMHWRTSSGATIPTVWWCYDKQCPPKC